MFYKSFSPNLLTNYLNRRFTINGKWNGKDEEIVVSLILYKTYKKHKPLNFQLLYPYKETTHNQVKSMDFNNYENMLFFFSKAVENNSDVDVLIKQVGNGNQLDPFHIPIQIKNIGRGDQKGLSTRGLIGFLEEIKNKYTIKKSTKDTLALLRGNTGTIKLNKIIKWLNKNKGEFPFYEVVILNKLPNDDMELIQVLPNTGIPRNIIFTKKEIKSVAN